VTGPKRLAVGASAFITLALIAAIVRCVLEHLPQ
jgi:hypothetical protein